MDQMIVLKYSVDGRKGHKGSRRNEGERAQKGARKSLSRRANPRTRSLVLAKLAAYCPPKAPPMRPLAVLKRLMGEDPSVIM